MLIVKGRNGKSVLVQILADHTESICFEYHDYPVMYGSYCIDSEIYSLSDFIDFIKEFDDDKEHYDYLIIYTNEKEDSLKELIDFLNKHKLNISHKDIIVMCKE